MPSAYEAVATSRPRIRRDLLFTRTPEGVLFHNAQGGFSLAASTAYRFASLLVPHLNGRHRVEEICAALGPAQREMVGELVQALYQRDFARDVPVHEDPATVGLPVAVAERFAAQLGYIDHYRDEPERRFARFRDTRVAVLGTDEVARWCVVSLVRNGSAHVGVTGGPDPGVAAEAAELDAAGCPVRVVPLTARGAADWAALQEYDVVVATGAADVAPLLAAGVPAGKALLPVWTLGSRVVAGPLSSGEPGCWLCAALRLGANGDPAAAAELWGGLTVPAAAGELPAGPVAAMLGNLLGYEIFRLTTGALPAETAGKVVIQNLETLDALSEPVLPHPGCPYCAEPAQALEPAGVFARPVEPAPSPDLDPDADADALLAELNERMVLVGRHAGVFTAFTDEPWQQTPLKVSSLELALRPGLRREIAAFDVHHVAGARRRALLAAAAVYADHVGRAPCGAPAGAAADRVEPAALGLATGLGVPAAGAAWSAAVSLLTGEASLVPAGAVHPFGPDNRAGLFTRTGAGAGAGASVAGAARRGLLSALGYHALLGAVRGTARPVRIDLGTVGTDSELTFLARSAGNLDVELELLDLTAAGVPELPVLLARARDAAGGTPPRWRLAAHPDWSRAAVAAVRDLLGAVQLARQLPAGRAVDEGDPVLPDFDAGTLPAGDQAPARLAVTGDWSTVPDGLRAAGLDALAANTTTADLRRAGLSTVRVLLLDRSGR